MFLGIDGGGTKTTCAVGDACRVLAMGEGGGSNITRCGQAQARSSIHEAIRKACAAAEVKPTAIEAVCVGASGGGRPEVSTQIERIVCEICHCPVHVVGDMVIALGAAFGSGPGTIVIAGTGSIAYGRDLNGQTARAGGWGFAISDEGSGQWIGRNAVTRALRSYDEGQPSAVLAAILREWPLMSVDDLVSAANAVPPPDFSRLFPAVLATADAGDEVARSILAEAGVELAELGKLVISRLFPEPVSATPVAMTGGVFRQSALVRQAFYNQIRAVFPAALINPTVVEPVLGAMEMARSRTRAVAAGSSEEGKLP